MTIEKIDKDNIDEALKLVADVFMQFEAPDYSQEGVKTFFDFLENEEVIDSLEKYGAFFDNQIVGVIATRNNGNHIALFFVAEAYQRQGIGKNLFLHILSKSTGNKITVNSSPYAVKIYERLGFIADDKEQVTTGIRYTAMSFAK